MDSGRTCVGRYLGKNLGLELTQEGFGREISQKGFRLADGAEGFGLAVVSVRTWARKVLVKRFVGKWFSKDLG